MRVFAYVRRQPCKNDDDCRVWCGSKFDTMPKAHIHQRGLGTQQTMENELMKNTDQNEQWSSLQKMFLPPSALRENTHRFWESQDKVLDSMQALANGWFERRHAGTHTAREAAECICGTNTFTDLMQAYRDWATGASERIMKDGLSWQQQIMTA